MLYIHIPFCKQACHYCDFHFSTNLDLKEKMVGAICKEIELQKSYLPSKTIETIYFGGGTPSILNEKELNEIFETIHSNFEIVKNAEITLEANPDDLSNDKLNIFKNIGINRLSIGVQSFNQHHLAFMNRAHNAIEATNCIENALNIGIDNLSIDLIYGIPSHNHRILESDIKLATSFGINHISAYCLTIESKTAFGRWTKAKKMAEIDDEFSSKQFEILMETLAVNNFEQYEISNFAKDKNYSKHNNSYWNGKSYLGIGPSAHSFDGQSRQFNISNNILYVNALSENRLNCEKEILSIKDKTNEYLMTSIRTIWGSDLNVLDSISNGQFNSQNEVQIYKYTQKKWLFSDGQNICLTKEGKFFADLIASDLFIE
jgi:oxygen-independent coproporphyrinogen III oxidase